MRCLCVLILMIVCGCAPSGKGAQLENKTDPAPGQPKQHFGLFDDLIPPENKKPHLTQDEKMKLFSIDIVRSISKTQYIRKIISVDCHETAYIMYFQDIKDFYLPCIILGPPDTMFNALKEAEHLCKVALKSGDDFSAVLYANLEGAIFLKTFFAALRTMDVQYITISVLTQISWNEGKQAFNEYEHKTATALVDLIYRTRQRTNDPFLLELLAWLYVKRTPIQNTFKGVEFFYQAAVLYSQLGRRDDVLQVAEQMSRYAPDHPLTKEVLAVLYAPPKPRAAKKPEQHPKQEEPALPPWLQEEFQKERVI